jgi:hypothetical protein
MPSLQDAREAMHRAMEQEMEELLQTQHQKKQMLLSRPRLLAQHRLPEHIALNRPAPFAQPTRQAGSRSCSIGMIQSCVSTATKSPISKRSRRKSLKHTVSRSSMLRYCHRLCVASVSHQMARWALTLTNSGGEVMQNSATMHANGQGPGEAPAVSTAASAR